MTYFRYLSISALLLAACAQDPGATVCNTGIICPTGMTCAAAQPVCIVNNCGNGLVEPSLGEACDDGNILIGDGCSPNCTLESCGDGVVVMGERCDDGNNVSGDGCSADCLSIETCGNLIKDVTEVCDDGNNISGDGCSANCMSAEVCGNGIKDVGEACDDGNTVGGDSCTPDCKAAAGCGNGVIDVDMMGIPTEECDDGNAIETDDCRLCKRALCGDGVEASTATGGFFEQCDGGVLNGTVARESADCNIDCTDVDCGDGKVNQTAGEQCDNGTVNDSAGCDMDNCTIPVCGDGHLNMLAGETCDPGTIGGNTQMCDSDCSTPSCGDHHVNTGFVPPGGTLPEACDDGNTTAGDGCSALCQIESCGNGVTEMVNGEQCDDGNTVDNDACRNNCQLPRCGDGIKSASEVCDTNGNSSSCDFDCTTPSCGDGVTNSSFTPLGGSAPENCDDGNTTAGDGCSPQCRIESCGNGVTESVNGEECDDGNNTDTDGCRNNCQLPRCGDGIKSASEACDTNGNSQTCNFNCTAPACGDGIMNPAFTPPGGSAVENCDDSNMTSGDGCSSLCRLEPFTLNLLKAGTGAGTVTSNPAGINCGADCIEVYPNSTVVTLTESPSTQSRFTGWSVGTCGTNTTCQVTMSAAQSVTASFEALRLTVTKSGAGTGTVTGGSGAINCGSTCTADFNNNTMVTLTAAPSADSLFLGWSGACTNASGTCTVTMSQARNVDAQFGLNTFTLTATKTGTGTGTVTSATPGIDCGSDCTENYLANTPVTLIATPDSTSTFAGWSGNPAVTCPGTGNCTVTMTQARTVTATFTIKTFTLTVTSPGSAGTVTGNGINCGGGNNTCMVTLNAGTNVSLAATPASAKAFSSWSGACAGQGTPCTFTIDGNKTVGVTFVDNRLTVVREGDGSGTVTGNQSPAINCGNTCSRSYNVGTVVTLTASPASGSRFGGWSEPEAPAGNCGPNLTCAVTLNGPITVTATFIDLDDVTVMFGGTGGGSVTWNPTAASCTSNCTRTFDDGTNVVITATENGSSLFTGWSGCSSTAGNQCTVSNLATNTTVTANFGAANAVAVTVTGTGMVTSTPAGISCSSGTCSAKFLTTANVSLMQTSTGTFNGWSGDCTGTMGCSFTMAAMRNVTATFTP
jgi:cysteine-rich repeat protein